jgi:hypothetical protein
MAIKITCPRIGMRFTGKLRMRTAIYSRRFEACTMGEQLMLDGLLLGFMLFSHKQVLKEYVHIAHACLFAPFAFCVTLVEIIQPNVPSTRTGRNIKGGSGLETKRGFVKTHTHAKKAKKNVDSPGREESTALLQRHACT